MKINKIIKLSSIFVFSLATISIIVSNKGIDKNIQKQKTVKNLSNVNNLKEDPTFVYIMSTNNPEDVFQNGFLQLGNNMNLEAHVTGGNNYLNILRGEHPDDGFISTARTQREVLEQLSILQDHHTVPNVFIYRVRATNFMYSLRRTASSIIELLNNERIPNIHYLSERYWNLHTLFWQFESEDDTNDQWFSSRAISSDLIESSQRVDLTRYDNEYLPIVDPNRITNPQYVDGPSNPNPAPYYAQGMILELGQQPNVAFINQGAGAAGFANMFAFNNGPGNNNKYSYLKIPNDKLVVIPKNKLSNLKNYLDKPIAQDIPMINTSSGHKGNLSLYGTYTIIGSDSGDDWIYDQDGRIGFVDGKNKFLFYCLNAPRKLGTWDYLKVVPALDNDKSQQWDMKLSKDNKYVYLTNREYPNYILGAKNGYLIIQKNNTGYDKMAIDYQTLKNKDIIFKKSYVDGSLSWFNLRWRWNGTTYYPTLSGSSWTDLYDAETLYYPKYNYILYVQFSTAKMWALTNERNSYDDWNWISWKQIDGDEFTNLPTNNKRMWKITKIGDKNSIADGSKIELNSYSNNDILWIQCYSTNWGSYFTSRQTSDYWKTSSKEHFSDYNPKY